MHREVIETADGSKTLYVPAMNEQYHSVNGALTESEYVFLKQGYLHHPSGNPVVFEVGFGTGLNALITALKASEQNRKTRYISIEKYPLSDDEIEALEYDKLFSPAAAKILNKIHAANWDEAVEISAHFTLHKVKGDLKTYPVTQLPNFDLVYFDAFGPDKQPDLWQPDIFENIYSACKPRATFVTYSAKGLIRRQLAAAGFEMERLPGPPGKRQMLRGSKK